MDATSSPPLPTPQGGPPLPHDVASCHQVIRELWAENRQLRARVVELEAKVEQLEAKLAALLKRSFASRSERSKQARKANRDAQDKPAKKRHEHGRKPLPAHLERREVIHDLTDEQKLCPCCKQPRVCISTHSVEQLDCDPIPFFVRKTTRKTYACQACKPSDVPGRQWSQTSGPAKVGPIPKGLCGPGLLAFVVTSKFADHLPLSRLEAIIARSGVKVSENTLGDWIRQAATLLKPLRDRMHRRVLKSHVVWTDDTRSRYAQPGRDTMPNGHFWVAIGDASAPFTVFDFTTGYSAQEGPEPFFEGFKGYLHADCLKQYESLFATKGVWHVACWAHARRKFLEAGDSAQPAVEFIRGLYRVERTLPEPDTPEHIAKRKTLRRSQSVAILESLKAWLESASKNALPKSPLGVAIAYVLNRWNAFERYTEEGDLSIDNNLSERTLRAIALGRKNWKFVGSASSGASAAIHYTLVGSCRHLGLDPFAYLRDVLPKLHALGTKPTDEQLTDLLPDAWARRRQAATAVTNVVA
jgi:transposase